MSEKLNPVPEGYSRLIPYITVKDGAAAIEFYRKAFGAEEVMRLAEPGGRIGHAELRFGDSIMMVSDEYPDHGALGPNSIGGSPVMIHLYVEDVDAVVARAVEAGARLDSPVENQFYGDRGGKLTDPFGHRWWVASRVEEVPPDEMRRRAEQLYGVS
jgi:PhnB protein